MASASAPGNRMCPHGVWALHAWPKLGQHMPCAWVESLHKGVSTPARNACVALRGVPLCMCVGFEGSCSLQCVVPRGATISTTCIASCSHQHWGPHLEPGWVCCGCCHKVGLVQSGLADGLVSTYMWLAQRSTARLLPAWQQCCRQQQVQLICSVARGVNGVILLVDRD